MMASLNKITAWSGVVFLHIFFLVVFTVLYVHLQHLYRVSQIRSAGERVKEALVSAESGQRGYLLTGSERYAENYSYDTVLLRMRVSYLCRLIPITPENRNDCRRLSELVGWKVSEMDSTLYLARQGRIAEALAIVKTDKGYQYSAEIKTLIDSIRTNSTPDGFLEGCLA